MDFRLSEEHQLLRDTVRRFSDQEIAPRVREFDRTGTHDPELLPRMADLGLLGLCLPQRYG
ncbi:MAG: acyl-CoA dehydrogenase family protein, partial [Armatimonadetes bacterium]|nr:acyl-CoA dehydrogenase family protein [Armatimonadota bacterium]